MPNKMPDVVQNYRNVLWGPEPDPRTGPLPSEYFSPMEFRNTRDTAHPTPYLVLPTKSRDTGQAEVFELSNYQQITAMYENCTALVEIGYSNCSVLAVRVDFDPEELPEELRDSEIYQEMIELFEVARRLDGYPVYDENAWSELEQELANEAWERNGHVYDDLRHSLSKCQDPRNYEAYGAYEIDPTTLQRAAYEVMDELGIYSEWEYSSVYYPGLQDEDTLKAILAKLDELDSN